MRRLRFLFALTLICYLCCIDLNAFDFGPPMIIKSGFQSLFEQIVRQEKLKVHLSSPVRLLRRSNNCRKVHLIIDPTHRAPYRRIFDFVVWSPEMRMSLKLWEDPTLEELYDFLRMRPNFVSGLLVDTLNMRVAKKSNATTNAFPEHWKRRVPDSIYVTYDPYILINGLDGTPMDPIITGVDGSPFRSTTLFMNHMHNNPRGRIDVEEEATKFLTTKFGVTNISVVASETWRYATQFSIRDIDRGILWRILEMQGKYGMWYIGSSVSFEYTEAVCLYNEQLVNNMEEPCRD